MVQFDFRKVRQQTPRVVTVRDQIGMMGLPFTLYLVDDKCGVSIDVQMLDSHIDGFFNSKDARLVLGHIVGALKHNPGTQTQSGL